MKSKLIALATAALLGLSLLVAPIAPASKASAAPAPTTNIQQLRDVFNGINQYRATKNLPALRLSSDISGIAQDWSDTMAETYGFYHNPNYSKQYPSGWHSAGEIIAYNQTRAGQTLVDQWIGSPGHEALMVGDFNIMGVGVGINSYNMYGTVNFAKYQDVNELITYKNVDEWVAANGADTRQDAVGKITQATGLGDGTIEVTGWALDLTRRNASTQAVITLDGKNVTTVTADKTNPNDPLLTRYGATGNHGFAAVITHGATTGRFADLCVIAKNKYGAGADSTPQCIKAYLMPGRPTNPNPPVDETQDAVGEITFVRDAGNGNVEVRGWAVDKSAPLLSSSARLWKKGSSDATTVIANLADPVAPGYEGRHGFSVLVAHGLTKSGTVEICGEALNTVGAGKHKAFPVCYEAPVTVRPPAPTPEPTPEPTPPPVPTPTPTPPPAPTPTPTPEPTPPPAPANPTVQRLEGSDRFDSAAAMSRQFNKPAEVNTVYLVSGVKFPDALSAAPVAAQPGNALLLTRPDALPASVATELKRLKPTKVVIVGGNDTVNQSVQAATSKAVPGAKIERYAGASRWETSIMLAEKAFPKATEAFIVSGQNFPDALSVGPVAAEKKAPVLLAPTADLTDSIRSHLKTAGYTKITVIGGTPSVSAKTFNSIKASSGVNVQRVAGSDRFVTNLLVSKLTNTGKQDGIIVASGVKFPDALAGAAIANNVGPLVLSRPQCMSATTVDVIKAEYKPGRIILLGGDNTLSNAVGKLTPCS